MNNKNNNVKRIIRIYDENLLHQTFKRAALSNVNNHPALLQLHSTLK
jgi:hypothetical protein